MANLSNINGKFVVEQTTGYVGVGTTDPSYPIEVLNASAEIALNASGGSIYRVQSDSTDSFRINKNGVGDRLVIDGSGYVGISVSTPSDYYAKNLVVTGPAEGGITIASTGNHTNYLLFADSTSGVARYAGMVGYAHDTDLMSFRTNSIQRMAIDSSGNVTVGNSSYGSSLGQIRIINDAASNPASLSLMGYNNVADGANYASIDLAMQSSGTGGNVVSSIRGLAVGTGENASNLAFYTATSGTLTERMRIDSSGTLSIGPQALDIQIKASSNNSGKNLIYLRGNAIGDKAEISLNHYGSANMFIGMGTTAATVMSLTATSGGTDGIIINTSGNVGIGTDSPSNLLSLKGLGNNWNTSPGIKLWDSTYSKGWYVGTANNDVAGDYYIRSVTSEAAYPVAADQQFTIKQNGNVGIGTISPGSILDIVDTSGTTTLTLGRSGEIPEIKAGGTNTDLRLSAVGPGGYLDLQTNGSSRMLIQAGGNVGIGTTAPFGKVDIQYDMDVDTGSITGLTAGVSQYGNINFSGVAAQTSGAAGTTMQGITWQVNNYLGSTNYGNQAQLVVGNNGNIGTFMGFFTSDNYGAAPVEAMRITSDGAIYMGRTGPDIATETGFRFDANGEAYASLDTSGTNAWHVYDMVNNAYRFFVSSAGQIYATATSISAISDVTLKENIKPLETGLNEVMKLQPRRFDWKNGDGKNIAGFVAQEVEQVLPDLVSDYKYNDEETKKSLKMGDMIPTLVKAIQELKAEIEILKNK